jgi:CelD/BcsL family acetyltransferase involved in cellulose biosynthesis
VAQFELVTAEERFDALAGEWSALFRQSGGALQFFQDWTWVSEWWRQVASAGRASLAIVVARQEGNAVLIWPWVVGRRAGMRLLQPTGGLLSCFDDALVAKHVDRQAMLEQAWAYLLRSVRCDAVELRAVHTGANIAALLHVNGGEPIDTTQAPAIELGDHANFDAYLASRSKKMRQNQRRSHKALGALGEVRGDGDDRKMPVELAIDRCLEFKMEWLSARGLSGKTVVTEEARRFLKRVARTYRESRDGPALCVSSVWLDDRPVSIGIGFRYDNCHFEYLGGFDYRLEQIGPGRVRMEEGIRACFAQGVRSYNMLTPQTAFKRIWTPGGPTVSHYIVATSVRGRIYRDLFVRRLRPRLKRAYNALPPRLRQRLTGFRIWG